MAAEADRAAPPDARSRIVAAGVRCLIRDGIVDASMASIAAEATVSKALLHYHFTDRAHLLAEIVAMLGRRIIARERATMASADAGGPVDLLWRWVSGELERGELHALLTIATIRDETVADALSRVRQSRHEATQRAIGITFERLGLTARVPVEALADACDTFVDGLAMRARNARDAADARLSFDVFWLAMLGLGE